MGRPSLALTFSSAAYIATGYLVSVGLARLLAPAGFGSYAVVTAFLTIVNFIVGRGVPVAASRTIAAAPSSLAATMRTAWRVTFWLVIATGTLTLLGSFPAAAVLGEELRVPLQVGAIAAFTFAVQAMSVAPLNGLRRFGWQAATRIGYAVSRVVLILLGAWQWGVTGAIAGYVAAPLIASIPAFFAPGRRGAPEAGGNPKAAGRAVATGPTARALLRQATPLLLTSVGISLLLTVDLIAIRAVTSAHDSGLYGVAGTLAHVPFFLMAMLPTEALPRIAAELDDARRRMLASRLLDDTVLMLTAPTLGLLAIGPRLIELIFGARYAGAGELVAPLALATAAVTIHSMLVAVDGAVSRLRLTVMLGAGGTLAMAAAVAVVGSSSGLEPAAWAAMLVASLLAIVHWRLTTRAGRIAAPSGGSLILIAAMLAFGAAPLLGWSGGWFELVGLLATALATVVAAPRLLRRS
ncbi:MAG: oligosaccharide flippase family protein [Gaiellales bacterium]